MRHRKGIKKLSKPTDQRIALLRGLSIGLIRDGKLVTSRPRAKEAKKMVEKIIGLAKKGGLTSLRRALQIVPDKKIITGFFKTAPERFASHAGGCTRITNIGLRRGDAADMVLLELI